MSVIVKSGGGENVTPEVTAQTPVITQILEGLVGKAQGANATADKILEGYSAYVGQELLEGTLTKNKCKIYSGTIIPSGDVTSLSIDNTFGSIDKVISVLLRFQAGGGSGTTTVYKNLLSDNVFYIYGNTTVLEDRVNITNDTITFNSHNSTYYFHGSATYTWEVLGYE